MKPIIFSGPMIRAILEGRKSMTRRVLDRRWTVLGDSWAGKKSDSAWSGLRFDKAVARNWDGDPHLGVPWCHPDDEPMPDEECGIYRVRPPYAVGDVLWCREAWRTESHAYDDLAPSEMDADYPVIYEADADWSLNKSVGRYRNAMHMPRWASRITLQVTGVKVERLQDISEEDAEAEGAAPQFARGWPSREHIGGFFQIWASLHGPGAWDANPWVVAITFDRLTSARVAG